MVIAGSREKVGVNGPLVPAPGPAEAFAMCLERGAVGEGVKGEVGEKKWRR